MYNVIRERIRQKFRTASYPNSPPAIADRFRGLPILDDTKCAEGCEKCAEACPTDAIGMASGKLSLDLGRCLFCTDCMSACPTGAVKYTNEYRMAAGSRDDLVITSDKQLELVQTFDAKLKSLYGRSLKIRQVSAAGCNGCEADTNVLNTLVFDLGRFGIQIVASPRHADGILITGPVSDNMKDALKATYDAVPPPKFVIAVGACAISGGPYIAHSVVNNGADSVVPVDVYVPGCPPNPWSILDGILRVMGRLDGTAAATAATAR